MQAEAAIASAEQSNLSAEQDAWRQEWQAKLLAEVPACADELEEEEIEEEVAVAAEEMGAAPPRNGEAAACADKQRKTTSVLRSQLAHGPAAPPKRLLPCSLPSHLHARGLGRQVR